MAAKLSLVDQTKLVTAASELARNTLVYGGGGQRRGRDRSTTGAGAASASSSPTTGPGIPDLDLALTDGYTTGGGLGPGPERRPPAGRRVRPRHRGRAGHHGHGDQVGAMSAGPVASRTSSWFRVDDAERRRRRPPRRRARWPRSSASPSARVAELGHRRHRARDATCVKHAERGRAAGALPAARRAATPASSSSPSTAAPAWPTWPRRPRDGHSTAGTLGIGLGAIGRLADRVDMLLRPRAGHRAGRPDAGADRGAPARRAGRPG